MIMRTELDANRAMMTRAHGPYAARIGSTFHKPAPSRMSAPRGFRALLARILAKD